MTRGPMLFSGGGGGAPSTLPAISPEFLALALTGEDLLDSSQYELPLSSGSVSASTSQFKFGSKALSLSGAGSGLGLLYPFPPLSFQVATTLGFWIRPGTVTANQAIIAQRDMATGNGWELIFANDGSFYVQTIASNSPAFIQTAAGLLLLDTWQHILVVYTGGTLYLFHNGLLAASGAISLSDIGSSTNGLAVLSRPNNTLPATAYLDDLFITREALTTAAYSVPTSAMVPAYPGGYSAWNAADKGAHVVLSSAARSAYVFNQTEGVRGTQGRSSGKLYFEVTLYGGNLAPDRNALVGVANASAALVFPGADANGWGFYPHSSQAYHGGSAISYGSSTQVVGVLVDFAAGSIRYKVSSTDPTTDAHTGLSGTLYPMWGPGSGAGSRAGAINTGAVPFALGLPAGASAWG